jgi:biotin carboxyl carrier protein
VPELLSFRAEKPNLRKLGDRLVIVVPLAEAWQAWVFDQMPPVPELPGLVEQIRVAGPKLVAHRDTVKVLPPQPETTVTFAGGQPADAVDEGGAALVVLQRLGDGPGRKAKNVLQIVANACVEAGICQMAVVAGSRAGKLKPLVASDTSAGPILDEIRHVLRQVTQDETRVLRVGKDTLDEHDLDPALLHDMLGQGDLVIAVPGTSDHGYALMLSGAVPKAEAQVAGILSAVNAVLPTQPPHPLKAKLIRGALAAAAIGAVVWLAMPTAMTVTANAVSHPAQARVMALPFDAFLETVRVRVGDTVELGDPIATLRAPSLSDQRAEIALQISVEQVSAQSALSANDYGAFVLSDQRIAQSQQRLDQIDARLEMLNLRAPVAGRVVQTLGQEVAGTYQATGETLAMIQPEARFVTALTVARVEAPLLQPGQRGSVWFRGISGQTWDFEILSAPMQRVDPTTGEETLVAQARIPGSDQARLFAGLAGFARIETGETVRIAALTRYAREYLRMKLWTWFDFQL